MFKDAGRDAILPEEQKVKVKKDESEVHSGDEDMGIIEEEDSLYFNSSLRSKNESHPQHNLQ